jgi:regulator of sirC expression with transglutaminase-like and TPR domain
MQGWFGKNKKENEEPLKEEMSSNSLSEFQDVLEKSLTEEKTQVLADRKQHNKLVAMVKLLLDHGYSIEDVNALVQTKKSYTVKEGKILEK